MKNIPIALFTVGIIMGGAMMFVLLSILQLPDILLSEKSVILTPTSETFPYLIALEPTHLLPATTRTPIRRVVASEQEQPSRQIPLNPMQTPLVVSNERLPERIGYSGEGRPLEVYTFGDGEHERMIVAGIHGGNEWNTITLANQLIRHFDQSPHLIPDDITLYILPNLNPDGEARAHDKY